MKLRIQILWLMFFGCFAVVRCAATSPLGQEGAKAEAQPATVAEQSKRVQLATPAPAQADASDPWRAILAAKTVAVIGMDYRKRCSQPPFPCGKRAKGQAELSLRKWGRFSLVEDLTKADLVVVTMDSAYYDPEGDEYWAQLRVFKGPVTPAFVAQVGETLWGQLRIYQGPGPLGKECEPLWEGWRRSKQPEVKNPTAPPIPILSPLQGLSDSLERKRRDKEFEKRVEQNPYDPEVIGEVARSIGDAVQSTKDLTDLLIGKTAKKLDMLVAEDFSRAVAEAEKATGVALSAQPGPPGRAAPTGERQIAWALPGGPMMWLEVATVLAGARPVDDMNAMVKERGIAFDADPEALWSLEALGASDAFLQAVREARVENYYEPDAATWADFSAEAEHTFRRVLETQPHNPVLQYALARSLDGQDRSDLAIAEYREALRLKPDFETAHINLGVTLGKSGYLDWAIKELREVIRLNPGNALAHENLGVALERKGDLDGSVAEHREAVRLKPERVHVRLNLGAALDAKGDRDSALAEYREAVRLAPRYARAHYAVGTALGRKGDLPGARLELQEALRLNPRDAPTHYVLGNVRRLQGDLDGAATEYREALRRQPDFPEADNNLTDVVRLMGKPGAAEKESRKAVRKNPQDPFAHSALGVALLRKGDLKGAIKELREAVRLKADYSDAHGNLGAALTREGKQEEAIAELREAVRLKSDSADTHFLLGQNLERKGDKAGALEAFRQAYTLAPDNPEYKAKCDKLSRQQ